MTCANAVLQRQNRSEVCIAYAALTANVQVHLAIYTAIVSPVESSLEGKTQLRITVVCLYNNTVLLTVFRQLGYIYLKRSITLSEMAASLLAVNIHDGIMINRLELQP